MFQIRMLLVSWGDGHYIFLDDQLPQSLSTLWYQAGRPVFSIGKAGVGKSTPCNYHRYRKNCSLITIQNHYIVLFLVGA
jgi:hypothetical protein